jgi:hypothetical protein
VLETKTEVQTFCILVLWLEAEEKFAAVWEFLPDAANCFQSGSPPIPLPLESLIDHQPDDPAFLGIRVESIHGETDQTLVGVNGQRNERRVNLGLCNGKHIVGNEAFLLGSGFQFDHTIETVSINRL